LTAVAITFGSSPNTGEGGEGPPNLQLYQGGYVFRLSDDSLPVPMGEIDRQPGLSIYGQLLQLESEGSTHIRSADPAVPPGIDPNWLAAAEDRRLAIETIRYIRRYASQKPLRRHIVEELLPGDACQSDDDLLLAFRRLAFCGLHGTGTCRMGGDTRSVVDERLRVRGVSELRVADCSVMPGLVSGNTHAPAMAIGYRAADLIIEDSR
jgi:choline dehydrogenase